MDYIKQHWPSLLMIYAIVLFTFYMLLDRQPITLIIGSIPGLLGVIGMVFNFILVGSAIKDEATLHKRSIGQQLLWYVRKTCIYIFLPALILTAILMVIVFVVSPEGFSR